MGILKKMATSWKAMTTVQKIDFVLDLITGVGCTAGGLVAGAKLSEGRGRLERACIKTATLGVGLAAQKVSRGALMEEYGTPLANAIDRAKARAAAEKEKEAVVNE